jgi:rhamnosyltransferase
MTSERRFDNRHGFNPSDVSIVIPTLNAAGHVEEQLTALSRQGFPAESYLIVDSSSTDDTPDRYAACGMEVVTIARSDFNHGGTRRLAVRHRPAAKFVVMMTQDAIPAHDRSLATILEGFADEHVGLSYGRQLPRPQARGIERHARLANYPPKSEIRGLDDSRHLGIKITFCSNSFAAYRQSALQAVGNFPEDSYFAEDQVVAGRMLLDGWKIAYQADATVVHSHGYSVIEDFRRYFDVGVFHSRNGWMLEAYGTAEGEGLRFIRSELGFLLKNDIRQIPSALIRTPAKYLAYRLGKVENRLNAKAKRLLSMQPFYWK